MPAAIELFHQLYTPVEVYPLPDGDTATLYFRAAGPRQPQNYPVILNETAPVAQNLNAWWSPGANLVFDSGDTAVWVGLHNLRADKVVIPQTEGKTGLAPLRDLQGTIFFVARHDTTTRAAVADNSYLAKILQSGDTTLEVYGRPTQPLADLPVAAPWSEIEFTEVRGLRGVQQGEVLPLEFHVKNLAGRPLKLSLRLLDAQGHVVAQNDVPADSGEPVRLGLFVPPGVAPGNYQLAAVLYDPDTLVPVTPDGAPMLPPSRPSPSPAPRCRRPGAAARQSQHRRRHPEAASQRHAWASTLEAAVRFYRTASASTAGIIGPNSNTAPLPSTCMALTAPSPTDFTLGHNVSSRAEVDAVMQQASRRRRHRQARPPHLLGRLLRLLPRPRRASVGGRVESSAAAC